MPPVLVADTGSGEAPLSPVLSIFDPMHVGIDEFGHPVQVPMIYRNMLIGGEPGAGKSALLNAIVAHAALSLDCRLVLLDGKQVELGQWRRCADAFVGPDIVQALSLLLRLQTMMDNRYAYLLGCERRKVAPIDTFLPYLLACDEIAYFSATTGDKKQRRVRRPAAGPGRPGTGGRHHRRRRHPTPVQRHHPDIVAGSVRVAVRGTLHHQLLQRHRAGAGLGAAGLVGQHDQPEQPRRGLVDRRRRCPAAGEDRVSR